MSNQSPLEPSDSPEISPSKIISLLMLGVFIWGMFHAMGVYVFAASSDIRKPMIVSACILVFLGGWQILLWFRSRHQ